MTSYTAHVRRENRWWVIEVKGLGVTQTRRLGDVGPMACDLISLMADRDPSDIDLVIEVNSPLRDEIDRALRARADAERAQAEARTRTRSTAAALRKEGLSIGDIADLLGVSFQRVSQLLAERKATDDHMDRAA